MKRVIELRKFFFLFFGAVFNLAINNKSISVTEMQKEGILQKAKEIDQNISDDFDVEKLRKTLKSSPSHSG